MRHLLLYLAISILCMYQSYASPSSLLNTPVTLNVEHTSINEVFKQISSQTGFIFSYNPQEIYITKIVSVKANNKPILIVLKDILEPSVTIKGHGKYIILSVETVPNNITINNKTDEIEEEVRNEEHIAVIEREILADLKKIPRLDSGEQYLVCHSSINFNNTNMITKKQITTFLAALALTTVTVQEVSAQQEEEAQTQKKYTEEIDDVPEAEGKKPFQASLVYPLSSSGANSKNYTYNFSVNIIGGNTGGLYGSEWGGIFNINHNRTIGAQFAGVFNKTEYIKGVQFAGVYNMTKNSDGASQFAGVFNYGGKGKTVTQFAGIGNVSNSSIIQASGIANVSENTNVQVAAIVNKARKSKVQIGIVNISDTANVQIGLVNLSKNGFIEVELAAGELLHTTASFRSGTKYLYGILSFGFNFSDKFGGYGAGLGTSIDLNKWGVNFEAVHFNLMDKDFWQDSHNQLTQIKALLHVNVGSKVRLFGGPVLNHYFGDNTADNKLNIDIPYTIWDKTKTGAKWKHASWVGFSAGVRVRF